MRKDFSDTMQNSAIVQHSYVFHHCFEYCFWFVLCFCTYFPYHDFMPNSCHSCLKKNVHIYALWTFTSDYSRRLYVCRVCHNVFKDTMHWQYTLWPLFHLGLVTLNNGRWLTSGISIFLVFRHFHVINSDLSELSEKS